MKVLIINMDCVGEGMGLAVRAAKAGHAVKIWMAKENHADTGRGFKGVERVDSWLADARWADLIVPTGNHLFLPKLDALRKMGLPIFGPSEKAAALEVQRERGMELFEEHGIEVPDYETFDSLEEAEAHVRETGDRFVFKTLGDEEDKSLSYVAKSPADMIARLQRWQRLKMNPQGKVMLQQVVEGIELGVSKWVGTEGFVGPYEEDFEHKKLLSGDCGPNCGEAGTVLKYVAESKLGAAVLAPLEEALVKLQAFGNVNVNCIVDDKGQPWPLEFTVRLGWPASNILWSLHQEDPVEWMADALAGLDSLKTSSKTAVGIVIAQPDYPYSKATKAELADIPIYGVTAGNAKYISPQAVKVDTMPDMKGTEVVDRDIWCTTGDYLCVVTGQASTVKKAAERAYGTVKEIAIPNMIYRDDIGEKLEQELPKLQALGYATEFKYGES